MGLAKNDIESCLRIRITFKKSIYRLADFYKVEMNTAVETKMSFLVKSYVDDLNVNQISLDGVKPKRKKSLLDLRFTE